MNRILWADDEIDLLKAHVIFLEKKGYEVVCVNNGYDAVEACGKEHFDIIFLDENMPGMNGLEALSKIKEIDNTVLYCHDNEERRGGYHEPGYRK